MPYADYHIHSNHSMDGRQTIAEACRAALAAGLDEVCFTDHIEFGHPDPGTDVPPDMDARARDLEAARAAFPQLTIRSGIEIGDNPACHDRIRAWLKQYPVDFLLLSMHLIDGVDPYYEPGMARESYFAGKTRAQAYRLYAECRVRQLQSWRPEEYDSLAHFGFVCKFAPYPPQTRPFVWQDAPDEIDAALAILAQSGKALEINTSGWKVTAEPIASESIVRRFRELGGEFVTFGSDSHTADYVGFRLAQARALARRCGFRYAITAEKREARPYAIPD